MTFEEWLALAREYGTLMYAWDEAEVTDLKMMFNQGFSPKNAIDALAEHFDLDSFADLHWGHNPPGYVASRYEVRP